MRRFLRLAFFCAPLLLCARAVPAEPPAIAIGDSLYNAHHPKMLFTPAEVPALMTKVSDGGYDDDAFQYLIFLAENAFPIWTTTNMLYGDFGSTTLPVLGLLTYLSVPEDTVSENRGRDLTLYVVDNYEVTTEETGSASRLRALTYGYDLFFRTAPDSLRQKVVAEMVGYLQTMTTGPYNIWVRRPYLANHSAWVAAAVGLAAICLDGEADAALLDDAIAYTDAIVDSLLLYQLDPGGSYKEGGLYIGWTMRHLAYYFFARKRHDGFNYGDHPRVREVENWVPYELLPEGGGRMNNMNDCTYYNYPLSYHHTFFDWAQYEWGSSLCAWIWERVTGPYGIDLGLQADKVATILWHQNLTPQDPNAVLSHSKLWEDRGLYHYRTGWQSGVSSDDVMFTFFSGKFHGGHAQEDQNQFTLTGYGSRLVIDHGPGNVKAKQSDAHNMVLIDGKGQHNAGGSIGLDGEISAHLLNGFADYVQGDATKAYTTHSPFNNNGYPFPGSNWSWGHDGGNPVLHALRDIVAVREGATPPYFIVMDDIDKDGSTHSYEWLLQTLQTNAVNVGEASVRIMDASTWLQVYPAGHEMSDLSIVTEPFDNQTLEPDGTRIRFGVTSDNPHFSFLLIPGNETVTEPEVTTKHVAWGSITHLAWAGGADDYYLFNPERSLARIDDTIRGRGGHREPAEHPRLVGASGSVLETDAAFALLRYDGEDLISYLAVDVSRLTTGPTVHVSISNGRASCALSGTTISIDRNDAAFLFFGPQVTDVECRGQPLAFDEINGYLTPAAGGEAYDGSTEAFSARLAPNPFNPVARLSVDLNVRTHVSVTIYDVLGRRVARLWEGTLPPGVHDFEWNPENGRHGSAASGVYFFRIEAAGYSRTLKAILLK